MTHSPRLTKSEMENCVEAVDQFSREAELWSTYVRLVSDISDIDFDFEMSSDSAAAYMMFVANILRPWLRDKAPEIDTEYRKFSVFHELVEQKAKLEIGR